MGNSKPSTCSDCGEKFMASFAGGLGYDTLHCNQCAKTTNVLFDQKQYDKLEENYIPCVERTLPKCKCGGSYTYDAEARCPKCNSTNVVQNDE